MICLLKEQLVVLGGVILKLEEFEGAAVFFFMKETMQSNVSCLRKQHDGRDQASNHQASG